MQGTEKWLHLPGEQNALFFYQEDKQLYTRYLYFRSKTRALRASTSPWTEATLCEAKRRKLQKVATLVFQ